MVDNPARCNRYRNASVRCPNYAQPRIIDRLPKSSGKACPTDRNWIVATFDVNVFGMLFSLQIYLGEYRVIEKVLPLLLE